MIYLTTGANGAGKTLLTLKDVRAQQVREGRPVYYHGFEANKELLEDQWGWKQHEPEAWQDLPDGSILLWDECQIYLGAKRWGSKEPPEWVMALGKFRRKRGFDIWAVCPHPSELHVSFRRLIDNPSWHRHLKRAFGADMVSVIKYGAPNLQCDKPGSGGVQGEVTMTPYPKEVYGWYKSASLHTGKRSIPRAVWLLGGACVLIPCLVFGTVFAMKRNQEQLRERIAGPSSGASAPVAGAAVRGAGGGVGGPGVRPIAEARNDYLLARQPRLDGLPHTAQAFDKVTEPAAAPYPAACVEGKFASVRGRGADCRCWTQQGTVLPTPAEICRQIVANGYFMEWKRDAMPNAAPVAQLAPQVATEPAEGSGLFVVGAAAAKPAAKAAIGASSAPRSDSAPFMAVGSTPKYDGAQIGLLRRGSNASP